MISIAHVSSAGSVLRTYADPAQPLTTAGEELEDLDHDLCDLSVVLTMCVPPRVVLCR